MSEKHLPAVVEHGAVEMSLDDTLKLAKVLAESGFFDKAKSASQACVKILAGRELGFSAMASMTGVHIIEGKPSVGAHLMAAAIKRSSRYDYDVIDMTRERCELVFWERRLPKGGETRKGLDGWVKQEKPLSMTFKEACDSDQAFTSEFEKDGSRKLKANWRRHPDDMLFARVISKGYRRYCPDLTGGVLVYTSEEMTDGEVIEGTRNGITPDQQATLVAAAAAQTPWNPPPASSQTTPPAQPGPAAAQPAQISEGNNAVLAKLIKDIVDAGGQVNVPALLKHFGIPALQKLPASRFDELFKMLDLKLAAAKGLAQQPASPPASPAPLTATEEGQKRLTLQREIDGYCEQFRFDPNQFKAQVKALFGTEEVSKLGIADLTVLRDRLANKAAQTQPTAKAG